MQIMPATWTSLTARYALGSDVYDARANMIGGALYLREMVDRYGVQGGLAAYNAGPGRYEAWRDGQRNLPRETVNYVAQIAPSSGGIAAPPSNTNVAPMAPSWKQSTIFVVFKSAVPMTADGTTTRTGTVNPLPPLRLSFEPRLQSTSKQERPGSNPLASSNSGLFANIAPQ